MTPVTIIEQAKAEGVVVSLTDGGAPKVTGGREAVQRWLPILRAHKAEILAVLRDQDGLPELEARIRTLALAWNYSPADLSFALAGARADPAGWRELCAFDAGWRRDHPGEAPGQVGHG